MSYPLKKNNSKEIRSLPSIGSFRERRSSWNIASDLPTSLRYAYKGVKYAFLTQRNFRIHTFIGFFTVLTGGWLSVGSIKMSILVLTIASVLVLELINTSIEAVVDLAIGRRYHYLAKIAKDSAAGAVLVASIFSLVIASLILMKPLLLKISSV